MPPTKPDLLSEEFLSEKRCLIESDDENKNDTELRAMENNNCYRFVRYKENPWSIGDLKFKFRLTQSLLFVRLQMIRN